MAEPQSAALGLLATPTICSHIYPATWTIRVYGQLYPSCTASTIPLDMTFGVGNGVRTRDLLNGNQILYQLSYTHIFGGKYRNWTYLFSFNFLERPIHATPVRTRLVVSSTVFTSLLIGLLIRTLRTSRYGISVASAGPVRLCLTFLTYSQYLRVSTAKELFIYVGIWNQLRRVVRSTGFEPVTPCL